MRIFRFCALVLSIATLTVGAQAQTSDVFATFNYTSLHTSNINEVNTNGTVVDNAYPVTLDKEGVTAGGDWSFLGENASSLGIDARVTIDPGMYQFFGGLRFAVHKHGSRFRAYVIGGGGSAYITLTENITTISKAPYPASTSSMPFPNDHLRGLVGGYGGVDIGIAGDFAWRVEVGGGFTTSASLGLTSSPGGGFFSLNTGPVFRF